MTETESWTIKRLLEWTTDFFKSKKLDSARLSAEVLLAEALDCKRIELYTRFGDVPPEELLATFRDWVKRHAKGEPVAYLVGSREFYSLKFEVNPYVLIPRPETEHVVIAAIDAARDRARDPINIADIGTGSGCIAVTLAKHIPSANLAATDRCPEAIELARTNARLHNVENRIEFSVGDLLDAVPDSFLLDMIVSNPPYIGRNENGTVDSSVRDFEPDAALFAGDVGHEVIDRLVQQSSQRLKPGGFLIFETSPIIFDRCLAIVRSVESFAEPETIKDLAGHRRIINVRKQV